METLEILGKAHAWQGCAPAALPRKASTMHPQKGDSSRRPCRIQVSEAADKPLEICPKDEEGIPKPSVVSENTIKMACLVSLVLLEVLGLYISINSG